METDFRVGDWEVDAQTNEIRRREEIRHLEPKVMDVLWYLPRHAGEVLTKERLIQAVWPETFVGDEVLTSAPRKLRIPS